MSTTERKQSAGIVTRQAFEKSLPDDAAELKKLAAHLSAKKGRVRKRTRRIKKRRSPSTQPT
ncbi:hypothetical protein [Corynebacterium diphtheriae]|uniref:hypothetical protein n=1 Tax=Corynebacterium diphtheriae TaxID=1717 RepID=UPI0011782F71|nr:hypothetical protein [Corynebacterium diphtheriae]